MSQPNKTIEFDAGWKASVSRVNAMNHCQTAARLQSLDTSGNDSTPDEELSGEEIIATFQANINAASEAKSYGKNPITLLIATYPALGSCGGSSRAFDRSINACKNDKRLSAKYSERQLIALAAARILAPLMDWPPGKFHQLHAVCCRIAETNQPENGEQQ